jgi:DNA polymerase-3 subunit gamma/tau
MAEAKRARPTIEEELPARVEPLHVHYRPSTWKEVIGQDAAVKTMSKLIKEKSSHCFLLTGSAGVGKTTLARIAARSLGASEGAIKAGEIDAATNTGVDAMRIIRDNSQWKSFDSDVKPFIVDECHRLSAAAWDCILKATEEPPAHVYWFFCTTNAAKVPATIKSRCTPINLKEVSEKDLKVLLDEVCESEDITLDDEIADVIVYEAHGSARQLLVNLATCSHMEDRDDVVEALRGAAETDATIELCRLLVKGGTWRSAMAIVQKMELTSFEGVRIVVTNYFGKVAAGAKNDEQAVRYLQLLENFATPYNQNEGIAPLLMSIGRTLFQG